MGESNQHIPFKANILTGQSRKNTGGNDIKRALFSFREEILVRREISSLTDFCSGQNKQTDRKSVV